MLVGIVLNVESGPDRSELVRCVACRRLYDLAFTTRATQAGACCPECGGTGWLAARVPITESAASPRQ